MTLVINEWYFSINLNLVTAFNFDVDVNLQIFQADMGETNTERFKERDTIDEQADQSSKNNILQAYREQLLDNLNEPGLNEALGAMPI